MQYIKWAEHIVHGDLGESVRFKRPVIDLIKERMPNTIRLGTLTLIFTYILAFPLGILSGRKPYSPLDYSIQVANYFLLALPSFVAGVFAIYLFAFQLNLFPFQGSVTMGLEEGTFAYYMSKLYHALLPALILGVMSTAGYVQFLSLIHI